MRRPGSRGRARALGLALAALFPAGCAPHRVAAPPVPAETRAALFRAALAGREDLGRGALAEVTLWLRTAEAGALPAASGTLALAGPDAARLRVGSMFGTAFDAAARGDSLVALLPSRRLGVQADAARDSIGVRLPGSLAYRLLAAAWRPPDPAWERAAESESLLVLGWEEGADSLVLALGTGGLPVSVRMRRADGLEVRARYPRWRRETRAAWPGLIEVEDGARTFQARCRVERVEFRERLEASRIAVRAPDRTRFVAWRDFTAELDGKQR